jgi:hypothetical protein
MLRECPNCHAGVRFANRTPYCPKCGWNRDSALSSARTSMNSLPIGILMFAAFISFLVFRWHFRNPAQIAIFTAVPTVGILFNYMATKKTLRTLEAMPSNGGSTQAAVATPTSISNQSSEATKDVAPPSDYEAISRAPRPRQVRLAKRGKISLTMGVVAALGFATFIATRAYVVWARTQSFASYRAGDWLMVGVAALLLLIPFGTWRSQVRECDLLENGETAIARVTRQLTDNKNNSSVWYEFTDVRGQVHQSSGVDYDQNLYPGMTVCVFYDTDNPKRNIAYCSTLHEVIV